LKRLIQSILASKWLTPLILVLLSIVIALLVVVGDQVNRGSLLWSLEQTAYQWGSQYQQWFEQQKPDNLLLLVPLAFVGGLVASISPCILTLLPINLSYIGTCEITSRRDALTKAGAFVLGVVTILSLFGLFSSVAGILLIEFQGYVHLAVGVIIVIMGLSLAGILRLPLPANRLNCMAKEQANSKSRTPWVSLGKTLHTVLIGPYGVGLTFALVSSPCTSPVLFAILATAAATGSQLQSTLIMVCYALGYTSIIFFASLFTGLAKQTRILLRHADSVVRIASMTLLLVGGVYLVNGIRWILASLMLRAN
jgi:cytochrome c-type biogenesis protein